MASNETPEEYEPVVTRLEDAADGAALHGATLPLKTNDEPTIRATLEDLAGKPAGPGGVPPAQKGKRALWNEAKEAKGDLRRLLTVARSNARAVLSACVDVLKPRLGKQWSNAWQAAGFTNHSIAIPADPLANLGQMRAYFESNPSHEKADVAPGVDASAAACEAQIQALSNARNASNQADSNASTAKAAYYASLAAGRARLTALRQELSHLLADDDPRWYAFGFDRPSDPDTPEVPTGVKIMPGAAGSKMVLVDWDDARRAENYRAALFNASNNQLIAEVIVSESECSFGSLTGGMQVRAVITARNKKGGESGESAAAMGVVP